MPLLIFQILQVKVTNTRNEYKKTNNEIIKKVLIPQTNINNKPLSEYKEC